MEDLHRTVKRLFSGHHHGLKRVDYSEVSAK